MRILTILLIKIIIIKTKNRKKKCNSFFVKKALDNAIKNFETTILYLKSL